MTTITKGEGFSALMAGYWAANEKLGPMPVWYNHGGDTKTVIVRPIERKGGSRITPEVLRAQIDETIRQERLIIARRNALENQLQEIIKRKAGEL